MDTVFNKPPVNIYYDREQNVLWSPEGLGADDRAGIFSIIKIVRAGFRPNIICTTDEEIGALGALAFSKVPCPFEDLKYIIQLDRRGTNDCVFYSCDNPDFVKYIEEFGFIENYGSYTDISKLCPAWGVAGVNLSIGYMNEHTESEILFVSAMLYTIERVKRMLSQENIPFFEYIPRAAYSSFGWPKHLSYYDELEKCDCCGKMVNVDNIMPVYTKKGTLENRCIGCLDDNIEWCAECYTAFEVDPKHPDSCFCPECRERILEGYDIRV
jgi:hypothetical protein